MMVYWLKKEKPKICDTTRINNVVAEIMPFKNECEILLYPNLPKKLYTTLVYVKNPNGKTYVYSNISIYDKETKKG